MGGVVLEVSGFADWFFRRVGGGGGGDEERGGTTETGFGQGGESESGDG